MIEGAPYSWPVNSEDIDLHKAVPVNDDKYQLTSSIYYGVRSYLHHFYEPSSRPFANDESGMLEDDFEFVVEPGRRERKCWFCLCMCIGLTVLLLGIALIVIGNLTPLKNPIIDVQGNLEMLDHKAIEFNKNIQTCQFSGLICFCAGSIIIMLTFLVSAYERECGCHNFRNRIIHQASVDPHAWIRYANNYTVDDGARIPLSREIKAVQIEKDKH